MKATKSKHAPSDETVDLWQAGLVEEAFAKKAVPAKKASAKKATPKKATKSKHAPSDETVDLWQAGLAEEAFAKAVVPVKKARRGRLATPMKNEISNKAAAREDR